MDWIEVDLTGLDWTGTIVNSPKNFSVLLTFYFMVKT